jgi:hypothetical protein
MSHYFGLRGHRIPIGGMLRPIILGEVVKILTSFFLLLAMSVTAIAGDLDGKFVEAIQLEVYNMGTDSSNSQSGVGAASGQRNFKVSVRSAIEDVCRTVDLDDDPVSVAQSFDDALSAALDERLNAAKARLPVQANERAAAVIEAKKIKIDKGPGSASSLPRALNDPNYLTQVVADCTVLLEGTS